MVEAALLELTGTCDMRPVRNAMLNFSLYYKGDGWYGDGPDQHIDFYNSYVIHPMMMDVALTLRRHQIEVPSFERNRPDTAVWQPDRKCSSVPTALIRPLAGLSFTVRELSICWHRPP